MFALVGGVSAQVPLNQNPARVLGQTQLPLNTLNPNLVEGRELFSPAGIAADTSVSPPILYISDTGNNRVLAWKNSASFQNGQKADLVIGQPDASTTINRQAGTLAAPTGLAVDKNGNLYVVDSGNNRILRFPAPFSQTNVLPDLVIGQTNFNINTANTGGRVAAGTMFLSTTNSILPAGITFDGQGNLWFSDPGNRRVLRYPATLLATGQNGPDADIVLGQPDFTSAVTPPTATTAATTGGYLAKDRFSQPQGLAFDSSGYLYVTDSDSNLSRVLVFPPNPQTNTLAARVLGVYPNQTAQSPPVTVGQVRLFGPTGVFMLGNNPAVVDYYASRILVYPPFSQWSQETTANPSPAASSVIGQFGDFSATPVNTNGSYASSLNAGRPTSSAATFAFPTCALLIGSELFVVDTGNHRVTVWPQQGGQFSNASRVLGQDSFQSSSVNLTEGREFDFTRPINPTGKSLFTVLDNAVLVDSKISQLNNSSADTAMVIDAASDPAHPHLYVADTFNNRVVAYLDWRSAKPGQNFDLIIGQPNGSTSLCNYPNNDPDKPSATSLCRPAGLAVDSSGNLWVADSGNGRVVRFPSPFKQSSQQADLVLGQSSLTSKGAPIATSSTLGFPYGLAFDGDNGLLVSDPAYNRVLFFKPSNGAYTNFQTAAKVFGQASFTSTTAATTAAPEDNLLNSPHHIARDTDGRLYVADTGVNRVVIFGTVNDPGTASADSHAVAILQGTPRSPRGIYVSPQTGEIWVTDTQGGRILHYPQFDKLAINSYASDSFIQARTNTLAVAADQYGDLFVADVGSRITIFFPGVVVVNGASFLLNRALAPGSWASVCPVPTSTKPCQPGDPNQFGSQTAVSSQVPLPPVLSDISVLVNGQSAPVYFVAPRQINFLIPSSIPTSGTADIQVVQNSTGQVLGSGQVSMSSASPALFAADGSGAGQLAALNQDNSVNSSGNPAPHGTVIQLFGTGQGVVSGGPADGGCLQRASQHLGDAARLHQHRLREQRLHSVLRTSSGADRCLADQRQDPRYRASEQSGHPVRAL